MRHYHVNLYTIKKILPKKVGKKTVLISLFMGIYMLGWSFVTPLFSIYLDLITDSNTSVGLIFTILPLLGMFFALPIGRLVDKLSKIKLLTLGLLGYLFVTLGYMYSWFDHTLIVISRILHSILVLVVWISAESFLKVSTRNIETAFSFYSFLQKALYLFGGGVLVLLLYTGFINLDNIYLVFLILFFIILFLSFLVPMVFGISHLLRLNLWKEIRDVIEKDGVVITEIKDLLKYGNNAHSMFIIQFTQSMFVTGLQIFFPIMIFKMNFPLWQIVVISLLPQISFILLPKIPELAKKLGDGFMLMLLALIGGISGMMIALSTDLTSFLIFYTFAIGSVLLSAPIINNIVTTNIPRSHYGELTGGLTVANKLGALVGGLMCGYISDLFSYETSFVAFSITLIIVSFITLIYFKIMIKIR